MAMGVGERVSAEITPLVGTLTAMASSRPEAAIGEKVDVITGAWS